MKERHNEIRRKYKKYESYLAKIGIKKSQVAAPGKRGVKADPATFSTLSKNTRVDIEVYAMLNPKSQK